MIYVVGFEKVLEMFRNDTEVNVLHQFIGSDHKRECDGKHESVEGSIVGLKWVAAETASILRSDSEQSRGGHDQKLQPTNLEGWDNWLLNSL